MKKHYKICTKTLMDTSDPNIIFNDAGESDYYTNYIENILPNWHTDERDFPYHSGESIENI